MTRNSTKPVVLYDTVAGPLRIQVIERDGQHCLFFVNTDGTLEGPMSRIDPKRPLFLLGEYTQAMMLVLLWKPEPERIAILGFGGGRLSLLLHHALPQVVIENYDIAAALFEIAEQYFAVQFDQRQLAKVSDARIGIETSTQRYDCILIDAFSDENENLAHLGTLEFFQMLQKHLTPGGIVALNLLRIDALLGAKAAAFAATFRFTSVVALKHSLVLFGGGFARVSHAQALRKATELQIHHQFEFPFEKHANKLRPFRLEDHGIAGSRALRDELK